MKRIILIGFMGSGKTTLGKKLANKLQVPFIDSDKEIEKHFGQSIAEIFTQFGESHFREIEAEFIQSIPKDSEFVLSTGGGMPCFSNNMDLLNEIGYTVYLQRPSKELAKRLTQGINKRPLLEGLSSEELLKFIDDRLKVREHYYLKAQLTPHRNDQTPEKLAGMISLLLPNRPILQKN